LAEATESMCETTAGRIGGGCDAVFDNHLPPKEFAMRTPSVSTVPSPWVGPARQDESPDFMSVAEAEALVEDHSPLETVKDLPPSLHSVPPTSDGGTSVELPSPPKSTKHMKKLFTGSATYLKFPEVKPAWNLSENYHAC